MRDHQKLAQFLGGVQIAAAKLKEIVQGKLSFIKFTFSSSLKHKGLNLEMNNWRGRKIVNDLYDSTRFITQDSYHIGVVEPPLNPFKN
jgi:hypothetical protein